MARYLVALVLLACGVARAEPQSREDAWWTGPMLAPSGATLPAGHWLIEPYLFDVMADGHFDQQGDHHAGPHEHDLGSLTYVLYGLTDRLTVGMIPRFAYNEPAGAPNSSAPGVGDFTLQAGYGLTQYHDGHYVPAIALVVQETLPTGRYERLARPAMASAAAATRPRSTCFPRTISGCRTGASCVRASTSPTPSHPRSACTTRASTARPFGFRGDARPGDGFTADLAGEYSVTRNWVLALDVVYQHNASTRITSRLPPGPAELPVPARIRLRRTPSVSRPPSSTTSAARSGCCSGCASSTSGAIPPRR